MIKAVLFDMDGVLVDSEEFMRNAAIEMFREKGFRVKAEDFLPFTGTGENRYIGGVAEKYKIDIEIEKDKARAYLIYEKLCRGKLEALPGAKQTIQLCKNKNLLKAVATSADEIKMLINLKEIGIPMRNFDASVFGEMVQNKKPDPEIFLCAAGLLGVDPGECLVIEDAPSGLKAAKAAGMKAVALKTSFPEPELQLADRIIPDLSFFDESMLD